MDPDLSAKLTQVYTMVNNLSLSQNINLSELKTLQDMQKSINDKVLRFQEEMARKSDSFKREMQTEIDNINRRISQYNSNNK